ncbi:uncharacterized protein LOC135842783 [Planococcus citri]|uniref:uncharacterized protein LOC135842783 n=1 Tax=Planococcus citri TaxID=170843 RepID=UPI0031F9B847
MRKFSILLCFVVGITTNHLTLGEIHADADFLSLTKQPYFVDTSVLIHKIFQYLACHKCQVNTNPHGFSKSINIDMIKRFAQIEVDQNGDTIPWNQTSQYDLFVNKLTVKAFYNDTLKHHLAYYPVIHIELKNVVGSTMAELISNLSQRIKKAYQEYEWLYKIYSKKFATTAGIKNEKSQLDFMKKVFENKDLSADDLKQSVATLVDTLFDYFNLTVFILIDDYDTPWIDVVKDKNNNLDLNEVHNLMTGIFGKLLEPEVDKHIEYIWMAGTNSVPFPHNMNEHTRFRRFMDSFPFAHFHSFEPKEMDALVKKFKLDELQVHELSYHYGGYYYPHNWMHVHRPSYVVKYLTNQPIDKSETKWIEHGDLSPLSMFLKNKVIRDKLTEVIEKRKFSFNITRLIKLEHWQKLADIIRGKGDPETFCPNIFFTILFENGYLSYSEQNNDFNKEKLLADFEKYNPDDDSFRDYIKCHDYKVPNALILNSLKAFLSSYKENL